MSISTYVIGIKPPDEKWKRMKLIWDNCEQEDIEIPGEVVDFFNAEKPDEKGVVVEVPHNDWSGESCEGIEIEVSKIPKDVKIIRFYNSW
jgi:hypothetical protein